LFDLLLLRDFITSGIRAQVFKIDWLAHIPLLCWGNTASFGSIAASCSIKQLHQGKATVVVCGEIGSED
jgi:hypothetical protein